MERDYQIYCTIFTKSIRKINVGITRAEGSATEASLRFIGHVLAKHMFYLSIVDKQRLQNEPVHNRMHHKLITLLKE